MESLYVNVKFYLKKKLASKVVIENLNRIEVTRGLLDRVKKGGPEFNSQEEE